jgi:predicted nucleic acid-binding protein
MEIVTDASVLLAVVLNEADRDWAIARTADCSLGAPEILPYEVGNALIAVHRKGRLSERELVRAFDICQNIAVRLTAVRVRDALRLAVRHHVYAYDAYYLQCCLENDLPLLSLDERMCAVARKLKIEVME